MGQQCRAKKHLLKKITQQESHLQTHRAFHWKIPRQCPAVTHERPCEADVVWSASVIFFCFVYGSNSKCFQ